MKGTSTCGGATSTSGYLAFTAEHTINTLLQFLILRFLPQSWGGRCTLQTSSKELGDRTLVPTKLLILLFF